MPAVLANNKYIPSPTLPQSPLDEPFYALECQCYWPAFLTSQSVISPREVSD